MALQAQDNRIIASHGKGHTAECQRVANCIQAMVSRFKGDALPVARELVATARCDDAHLGRFKPLRQSFLDNVGPRVYGKVASDMQGRPVYREPINETELAVIERAVINDRAAIYSISAGCQTFLDRLLWALGPA